MRFSVYLPGTLYLLFCNFFVRLKHFQNEKLKNCFKILMFLHFFPFWHFRDNRISIFSLLGILNIGEIGPCTIECTLIIVKKRPKMHIVGSLSDDFNKCVL